MEKKKEIKEKITIDNNVYVLLSSVKNNKRESISNKKCVLVRTYSAGVFVGYLKSRLGKEVVLYDSRRIWYWDGANSLSQLACEGVTKPDNCKFGMLVDEVLLTECIELMPVTDVARDIIYGVKEWKV